MADITLDDLYRLIGLKDALILKEQKENERLREENDDLRKKLQIAESKKVSAIPIGQNKKPTKKG